MDDVVVVAMLQRTGQLHDPRGGFLGRETSVVAGRVVIALPPFVQGFVQFTAGGVLQD